MKVAFDTNMLVRIIVNDDPKMATIAVQLIKKYGPKEIFICYAVLLETSYVLKKVYGFSQEDIYTKISDLLRIEQFHFEHEIPVRLALSKAIKGMSFYDALIGEIAAARSLKTFTFDKGLKNDKNFIFP